MRGSLVVLACCIATPARAYDCASLLESLRGAVRDAEQRPIPLASPARRAPGQEGAGERCAAATGALERGTVDGHSARVRSDGPHGSGHYWDVWLEVGLGPGRPVGVCMTTSTAGWRNLGARGRRWFGAWRPLAGDRFVVWTTLRAGSSESEGLIHALVYRLRGAALVLDRGATIAAIRRMGQAYATVASADGDDAAELHRAAAAAYAAFVDGSDCAKP